MIKDIINTSKITFFGDTHEDIYSQIEDFNKEYNTYAEHIIFDREYEIKTKGAKAYVKFVEVDYYAYKTY